jgi:GntR family transcriptional repressor for pyruvate dehydrogenase complex
MYTRKGVAQRNTLVDDTAERIRQMILTGEVQPGEFLPSRKELAARFDVGLSTVHEAIQALTAVGLVNSRPGKGTWVRPDGLDSPIHPAAVKAQLGTLDAQMLYEARLVTEVALTEFAARRASPQDVERIWNALEAMEATVEEDGEFVEADWEFHLAVAKAGDNALLETFYHVSRRLLVDVLSDLVKLPRIKEDAIRLQRAIADAITRHDPERARQAALDHMRSIEPAFRGE